MEVDRALLSRSPAATLKVQHLICGTLIFALAYHFCAEKESAGPYALTTCVCTFTGREQRTDQARADECMKCALVPPSDQSSLRKQSRAGCRVVIICTCRLRLSVVDTFNEIVSLGIVEFSRDLSRTTPAKLRRVDGAWINAMVLRAALLLHQQHV